MAYLTLMAAGLAVPLWLAIYEPESRFSRDHLPEKDQVLFWLKWIAAIAVLFLIGNINAADHMDAMVRTIHVFAAFAVIAIFASGIKVLDRNSRAIIFRALLWGVITAGIILTLIGLAHPYRIPFWRETKLLVPHAPFYNRALVVLVFMGAVAIARAIIEGRKKLSFAAAGFIFSATLLSSSESAKLVILMLAFVGFLVWRMGKSAILCLTALALTWIWMSPWIASFAHNLASGSDWVEQARPLSSTLLTLLARVEVWAASGNQILLNPFAGWGLDGIEHHGLPTLQHIFFPSDYVHHPHNGAIQAWIDFGILGPVVFSVALSLLAGHILRTQDRYRPWLAALAFGAISLIFVSHGLWETWWIGLLGYVYGMVGIATIIEAKNSCGPSRLP